LRGIALDSADAQRLADLAGNSEWVKWHVRSYHRLGLDNDLPSFLALWRPEEEFTISQFVAILCEIPPDGTVSRLHTGSDHRKDAPPCWCFPERLWRFAGPPYARASRTLASAKVPPPFGRLG
jgi:hypothetical protein